MEIADGQHQKSKLTIREGAENVSQYHCSHNPPCCELLRSADEKLEKAKEGLRFIQTIGKNADGLFYYGKEDPDLEGVKKIAKQTLAEIGEKE